MLFSPKVRMGKKCDQSNMGGLSISETADLLGFSRTPISTEFTENDAKNKNHPVSSNSAGKNML